MLKRRVKFLSVRLGVQDLQSDEMALNAFLESKRVRKIIPTLVVGSSPFWSVFVEWMEGDEDRDDYSSAETGKILVEDPAQLTAEEMILYGKMRVWRHDVAWQRRVPEYVIMHNSHLATIARTKPRTEADLLRIHGVGRRKVGEYGNQILGIITQHLESEAKSNS